MLTAFIFSINCYIVKRVKILGHQKDYEKLHIERCYGYKLLQPFFGLMTFTSLPTHRNTLIRSKDTINIKSQWNCFLMLTKTGIQPVFRKCQNFHLGDLGVISTFSCSYC